MSYAGRFWAKVEKGDCWEWRASREAFGYGVFTVDGRRELAHRVAWRLIMGDIPDGMCVLHRCDNPPCVNPAHLFLGNRRDNQRDMARKGRSTHGAKNSTAKLTSRTAAAILRRVRSGERQKDAAARYGVTQSLVSRLVNGKIWLREVHGQPWSVEATAWRRGRKRYRVTEVTK